MVSTPILLASIGALLMAAIGGRRSRIAICFAGVATAAAALCLGNVVAALILDEAEFRYFYPSPFMLPARQLYRLYWVGAHATYFALIASAGVLLLSSMFALRPREPARRATLIAYVTLSPAAAGAAMGSLVAMNRASVRTVTALLDPSSVSTSNVAVQLDFALFLGAIGLIIAIILFAVALSPERGVARRDSLSWAVLPAALAALILIQIPTFRARLAAYHHVAITGSYANLAR